MEEVNLFAIVGIIGTFILLLLAFFLFSVQSENKISNKLFGVFLILFALDISDLFLYLFIDNNTHLIFRNIRYLMPSVQIPVFYLYFLSVCFENFKIQKKHLYHLIPYFFLNLIFVPRFYFADINSRIYISKNFKQSYEFITSHIVIHLQILVYGLACFYVLKKAKQIFIQNYSGGTIKTYDWLFQLLISYTFLYGIAFIKNILKFTNYNTSFEVCQVIIAFAVLIVICWYVLNALKNPYLFKGVDSNIALIENLTKNIPDNIDEQKNITKLNEFMIKEEPYLDSSLTIKNLATQLEMPMRDLSILINQNLNKHFFDLVNEYRIKKAMSILKDTSKNKLTILEILYEVGFNSKSSFNTAFKKHTGKTPTQFRKTY